MSTHDDSPRSSTPSASPSSLTPMAGDTQQTPPIVEPAGGAGTASNAEVSRSTNTNANGPTNDTVRSTPPAPPSAAARSNAPRRAGLLLLWLLVLILAAALAWVWQDGKRRVTAWQAENAQRLGALEKTQATQVVRDSQYESRLRIAQEKVAALETRVDDLQTSRQALEKLYQQLLPLRDEVTMREVEYRLRFAAQQLSMSGNVSGALAALQDADAELTQLSRADLAPLKTALMHDIETLQRVPVFDSRAFLTRLDQILITTDQIAPRTIPTAMPAHTIAVDAADPAWERWWSEVKETLLSMVRLRVGDVDVNGPRVADVALDRQELRLRLLSLRLMVLSRQPMVKAEAMATRAWLEQHFSADDTRVETLQALLGELAASPVASPLPEATQALLALRVWRAAQH